MYTENKPEPTTICCGCLKHKELIYVEAINRRMCYDCFTHIMDELIEQYVEYNTQGKGATDVVVFND